MDGPETFAPPAESSCVVTTVDIGLCDYHGTGIKKSQNPIYNIIRYAISHVLHSQDYGSHGPREMGLEVPFPSLVLLSNVAWYYVLSLVFLSVKLDGAAQILGNKMSFQGLLITALAHTSTFRMMVWFT